MCVELLDEHPVGVLLHGFQVGYVEYGCWQQPPPLPVHVEWLLDEGGLEAPHTLSVPVHRVGGVELEWGHHVGLTLNPALRGIPEFHSPDAVDWDTEGVWS